MICRAQNINFSATNQSKKLSEQATALCELIMADLKIYLSSTYLDMAQAGIRKSIIDKIQGAFTEFFGLSKIMEQMKGDSRNRTNMDFCLDEVRHADLYIILVADRYGSSPETYLDENRIEQKNEQLLSYTELEYDTAQRVIAKKFYGIYQFYITDKFFASNNIDNQSDLDDPMLKQKHEDFIKKLKARNQLIEINSLDDLNREINDKLTEFYFYYQDFPNLGITDGDKIQINRQSQIETIRTKKNTYTEPALGESSRCVMLLFNTCGKLDYYDKFNIRLKLEAIGSKEMVDVEIYNLLNGMASRSFEDANYERFFNVLLRTFSNSLFGSTATALTFETFYDEIREQRVQTRFISLEIETDKDNDAMNKRCFDIITQFINKIEALLLLNNFKYNFYFAISLVEKDLSPKDFVGYYDYIKCQSPQIECVNLDQLGLVTKTHVIDWLSDIVAKRKNIVKTVDEIYNFIFINGDDNPKYYSDFIDPIEKRTSV